MVPKIAPKMKQDIKLTQLKKVMVLDRHKIKTMAISYLLLGAILWHLNISPVLASNHPLNSLL